MELIAFWLCFGFANVVTKTVFMFEYGIPLLIIPIAFNIYSIICVFSFLNQWDPEELQRQAEELDNHFDHCVYVETVWQ